LISFVIQSNDSITAHQQTMTKIADLHPGETVRLLDFGLTPVSYRQKLLSLGMTRGVEFSVLKIAPLGCPVLIQVRGTALSLRKDEASQLVLERI
jgi:ferrous iron transport protein A